MTQAAIGTNPQTEVNLRSIVNPATGAVIDTLPEQGPEAVDAAVASALAALEHGAWPTMVRSARARLLLRIADAIEADSERLYRLEALNNGRPITETRAQLSRVPEWFRYNAGLLAAQRQAVLPGDGPYLTYQQRLPLGVCGIITPFNHPLLILARSLSAALANGNTVVVKPSELTPLTTLALLDIMIRAGLPEGVVNVVTGGRDAGDPASRRRQDHADGRNRGGPRSCAGHCHAIRQGDCGTRREDPRHRVRRRRSRGCGGGCCLRGIRGGGPIVCRRLTIPGAASQLRRVRHRPGGPRLGHPNR
jgi:delta 1-pyrroline-5-carboxylate dehydrogenase